MNDTPAPNSRLQQALSILVDLARSYGDAFKDAIHEYVESDELKQALAAYLENPPTLTETEVAAARLELTDKLSLIVAEIALPREKRDLVRLVRAANTAFSTLSDYPQLHGEGTSQ